MNDSYLHGVCVCVCVWKRRKEIAELNSSGLLQTQATNRTEEDMILSCAYNLRHSFNYGEVQEWIVELKSSVLIHSSKLSYPVQWTQEQYACVCVCVCVCVYVCMYSMCVCNMCVIVCECVCVRERERERKRIFVQKKELNINTQDPFSLKSTHSASSVRTTLMMVYCSTPTMQRLMNGLQQNHISHNHISHNHISHNHISYLYANTQTCRI